MKNKTIIFAAGLILAGSLAFSALTGFACGSGVQMAWMVLLLLLFAGQCRFWEEKDRRAKGCFGVIGAGFVLAFALGRRLEMFDRTGWDGLALSLLTALCFGPAVGQGLLVLSRRLEKLSPADKVRGVFWRSFGLILLGWTPVWLACFPCIFGYDLSAQLHQVISGNYSAHHPLLHTLLAGGLYRLGGAVGSYTLGALVYVVLQMTLLAASMAYALNYLHQIGCPRSVRIVLTVLFALAPNHQVLAIGTTKDVMFAALFVFAAVEIHRVFRSPARLGSPRAVIALILPLCGMCLMRNNAVMAVAVWIIPAVWLIGRGNRRRLIAVMAAALVVYGGADAGLKAATGAEDASINEMLSVPAQQIARVYDRFGTETPAGFEALEWVPNAGRYQPLCADNVKLHLKVQREGELMGFLKFWLREFFHYPIEYLDAFLLNAKGYWHPEDTSFSRVYGQWPEGTVGALIIEQYDWFDVQFTSFLPAVRSLYEWLFSQNNYQSIPGLSTLIHPATYTWLLLFALAWAVWRRRWEVLATGTLMLMYLLTLFLGPCTLVRYCYYLMIAAPVLISLLLSPGKTKTE